MRSSRFFIQNIDIVQPPYSLVSLCYNSLTVFSGETELQNGKMDGMNYAPVFAGVTEKVVASGEFRFSVIGLDHGHIYAMTSCLIAAGAELVAVADENPEKIKIFRNKYPQTVVMTEEEILNDGSINLVVSAIRPDKRAALGIRAMKSGKHFFCDKPGMLKMKDLAVVRKVALDTGMKYMVYFGERVHVEGALFAQRLIDSGKLGKIVTVTILAPHRLNPSTRPDWFFDPEKNGGILADIGSHQMEQLLTYTHSEHAEIKYSAVGNMAHPDYPEFQDFGEAVVVTDSGASCYVRGDWFTPDGLGAWGDGRVFLVGTEGTCEIRKYINVGADRMGDHVFFTDKEGEHHYQVTGTVGFPFFGAFIRDCIDGTENAMSQEHVFESIRLAIEASDKASRLKGLR